jgi:hypothetical protein
MGLNGMAHSLFLSLQLLNFYAHVNKPQLLGEMQGIFAKKLTLSSKHVNFM